MKRRTLLATAGATITGAAGCFALAARDDDESDDQENETENTTSNETDQNTSDGGPAVSDEEPPGNAYEPEEPVTRKEDSPHGDEIARPADAAETIEIVDHRSETQNYVERDQTELTVVVELKAGEFPLANISVVAQAFDDAGTKIGEETATVSRLAPEESTEIEIPTYVAPDAAAEYRVGIQSAQYG